MKKGNIRPHGQLRRSQVVTTFGPGAMLDLPNQSVLLGGLELWGDPQKGGFSLIREERLLEKVGRVLGRTDIAMYAPPVDAGEEATTGITALLFPEWFIAQHEEVWGDGVRSRRLLHRRGLTRGKYFGTDKKRYPVVPVRFVQACVGGHIDDIDWFAFVHRKRDDECRRQLWFDERGTSGDLTDITVRCECRKARNMAEILVIAEGFSPLGYCRGRRPWLGAGATEECKGPSGKAFPNRLLVRSASNAYFPQVLSVISIPEKDEVLRKAVDPVWEDYLRYLDEQGDLKKERKKPKVAAALQGLSDSEVWAEIERRKSGVARPDKSIKQAEIETLLGQPESVGEDVPDGDFYATTLPRSGALEGPLSCIDRVVLVHRLREVTAQVGFTRFEAAMPDIDGELALDVRRAALSRDAAWVPAVENRGEGVLLSFRPQSLDDWAGSEKTKRRMKQLRAGFDAWSKAHAGVKMEFPGPRYLLLHSLSHMLITTVSLACGYSASSIRERVYATEAGCGILLYTGTPDAEGTLGGLVGIGRHIERHLRAALENAMLCSNDPVCAQHQPDNKHVERFLHGAACHGCLLIAEPSCERRNEYLDRALVVPTVEGQGAEFFQEEDIG